MTAGAVPQPIEGDYCVKDSAREQRRARQRKLGRRPNLVGTGGLIQDVIARALCLGGGVNDELAVITELLEPFREVRGRVVDRAALDAGDPA